MGHQFSLWDRHTLRNAGGDASLRSQHLDRTAGFDKFEFVDGQQRARLEVEYWRRVQYWTDTTGPAVRWAGIAMIAAATLARARYWREVRLHRTLKRHHCPDCEYDLNGANAAIDPDRFGGHSVGPRRRPECGAPWPLLPAVMPGSVF